MSGEADPQSDARGVPGSTAAAELASRLIDSDEVPALLSEADRSALAWALKDLCYAAWSSEPQRAAAAAAALRRLCAPHADNLLPSQPLCEVTALAEWTAGIACLTRGQMTEAAGCFDLAAEIFRGLGQSHHAAQTQVPKIMALSMLGQHSAAADCAERTQREFAALGDVRAAGKVSLNLGSLHLRRDAFRQAARHYREAAVLFARVGDREHSVMADIGLADALTSLGDFDEAARIYARAAVRAGTHGFPVLVAMVEESLALLELARGNYREALAGFEGSRRRYEQLAMPQHLAIAEKQLADAYLDLHLLPEALALFDRVLIKFRVLDMPDDEAWTLAQMARAQVLLDHLDSAADSLVRAAAAFTAQRNGVGEAAVALVRAELALVRNDAGAALELADRAERGFAAADLPERCARAAVVRAGALLRAGSVDDARALFDATLLRARELPLLSVQVRCLTGQGMAAQAVGDHVAARAAFRSAVELFEETRRTLPGDEIRSAFLTDHLRPYQELLRLALDDHARAASPALAAEVLRQLDRLRARALGERLAAVDYRDDATGPGEGNNRRDDATGPGEGNNRRNDPPHGIGADQGGNTPPADTEALRARLNWLYRRVQRLQDEASPSAVLTAELRNTEHELLERARRGRLAASVRDPATGPTEGVDVAGLVELLDDGDALVEYGVQGDELFACVVTCHGVALQRHVACWPDVLDAVQSARFQLETLRHGAAPVARHLATLTKRATARLRALHALVWAPLAGALRPCRRVLIVPHAQLGAVPFAALDDGERTLAQRYELAFAPSARVALRGLRRESVPARCALCLGESTRLPHAAAEARLVAGLFPQATVFVGEAATLAALRAHAAAADVIHFACHAQFRSDNPMFSALHLADGALTVEAIERMSLAPCTVVLSACETGLADHGKGDEMVGLVRAFLVAGAARVLGSLWPVDDEITSRFMALFHGALCRGIGPAESLRLAQAELIRHHPHPYYWGAFTLNGRW
ncbi:MAG: CHAT domain-containing protein [Betaproteobacteria bacterium]